MKITIGSVVIAMGRWPHETLVSVDGTLVGPWKRFMVSAQGMDENQLTKREIVFPARVDGQINHGLCEKFAAEGFDVFIDHDGKEELVIEGRVD